MRLIDGDALKQEFEDLAAIQWNKDTCTTCARAFKESAERVEDAKTVGAFEQKCGRWIGEPNCWYRCSKCGEHYPSMRGYMDYNFCPNCGADMRGVEE